MCAASKHTASQVTIFARTVSGAIDAQSPFRRHPGAPSRHLGAIHAAIGLHMELSSGSAGRPCTA